MGYHVIAEVAKRKLLRDIEAHAERELEAHRKMFEKPTADPSPVDLAMACFQAFGGMAHMHDYGQGLQASTNRSGGLYLPASVAAICSLF